MKKNKKLNLIIVAHPDDEILGFGATGAKLVENDEIVQPVILCGDADARTNRPNNAELNKDMIDASQQVGFSDPILGSFPNIRMNNEDHIDIVQFIEKQIIDFKPTRIFTHHPSDLNNDHYHTSIACQAASKLSQRKNDIVELKELLFMEVLSATDWSLNTSHRQFTPNVFIEIKDTRLKKKIKALGIYDGVMRHYPHPRSKESIRGLAAYRGSQSGLVYAEAFESVFRKEGEA